MERKNYFNIIFLFSLMLMISIFIVDLIIPLGVAGGVPYIAVILISLWLHNSKFVLIFASISTILTISGFYFSPDGGELWKVLFNRALALFAIWVTAVLVIRWNSSQQEILNAKYETEKEKAKKEIYIATMESAYHIIGNLLNQLQLVRLKLEQNANTSSNEVIMFDKMTAEAQDLLQKLSTVKQIEADKIKESVHPR